MLELSKLYELLPEFDRLRLRRTVVDRARKEVVYTFSYPEPVTLEQRKKLYATISEMSQTDYVLSCYYVRDTLDMDSIMNELNDYNSRNFPSLRSKIARCATVKLSNDNASIVFKVDKATAQNLNKMEYLSQLSEHFNGFSCFKYAFDTDISLKGEDLDVLLSSVERYQQLQQSKELSKPVRYMEISNVRQLIGKKITYRPGYVVDITGPSRGVTACGRIESKQKYISQKTTSLICKFVLNDGTASIPCVLFAKTETAHKYDLLSEGEEVVVSAIADINKFSGALELKIFDLSLCAILPLDAQPKYTKDAPDRYNAVTPTPFEQLKQLDLGFGLPSQEKAQCNFLLENNVVALHLMTTGQKVLSDRIISVDAVRIVRGVPKERFACLVNPEMNFLAQIDKDSQPELYERIDRAQKSQYVIGQIVPDLYKFCDDCVLVFDSMETELTFLRYYSNPSNYYWGNKCYDISQLGQALLATDKYASRKSSATDLQSLCERFGIVYTSDIASTLTNVFLHIVNEEENLL